MNILIFPAHVDRARPYITMLADLGCKIFAASSVPPLPTRGTDLDWYHLPFVTDESFDDELHRLLERHGIEHVIAPHSGIWWHLSRLLIEAPNRYRFRLCGPHPYHSDWQNVEESFQWASELLASSFAQDLHGSTHTASRDDRKMLTRTQYAALHSRFVSLPGECDDRKLYAFAGVFAGLPKGDVVEIGSLMGQSAFALGTLAHTFGVGSVICVDPWNLSVVDDQGKAARALNDQLQPRKELLDFDRVFELFRLHVASLGNVSYIRRTSVDAVHLYIEAAQTGSLRCQELGMIPVTGSIAFLHIDGNHRFDHVMRDIVNWSPFVRPGGWIALDDYVWPFGDGPRRAGDELLSSEAFDNAFCTEDTLFLRRSGANSDPQKYPSTDEN